MKRLAIFLDGTWNDEGSQTNVHRLYESVSVPDTPVDGVMQDKYYDLGVGTKRLQKVSGGALGKGLSKNVQQAYSWLLKRYDDGDHVYI